MLCDEVGQREIEGPVGKIRQPVSTPARGNIGDAIQGPL